MDEVSMVEQFIDNNSESPEQAAAVKKLLGIEKEAEKAALAWVPERPTPNHVPEVDHLAHARAAVVQYEAWVDAFPGDGVKPLAERQRVLALARADVKRLERKHNVGL